jgi:sigma-B regulation protein RsbU (phosphoserine phosphatase)
VKILVAEDDPVPRRLLERYLAGWGHQVSLAHDGAYAWDLFQDDEFPVVITDWNMPGMDGPELIRRIRSRQGPGYVYVILLTGKSQREDLIVGMESGADDFISKPFDRDELRVRLRAGERIIELEQSLARRNDDLRALNADLSSANQRMKHDLDAAARVQQALLPNEPLDVPGVRVGWAYKPCDVLAGDILNVFRLDERTLGFYVLDVSGHGVASALLSVTVSRFLSPAPDGTSLLLRRVEGVPDAVVPPSVVASLLNRRFVWDPATEQYFTLIYGVIDLPTLEFRYISAGHPGLVHIAGSTQPQIHEEPGFPIGVVDSDFEEHTIRLSPGDRLVLYSDGLIEAMNPQRELFGKERLLQQLDETRGAPIPESVSALLDAAEQWRGTAPLSDDVSILALEIER